MIKIKVPDLPRDLWIGIHKEQGPFLYDKLLITTGSTNRKLEVNSQIDNDIYYLRNLDEAVKIKNKASSF